MGNKDDFLSTSDSPESVSTPVGESSTAISLQTTSDFETPTTRYFDDDPAEFNDSDLPPLYTDLDNPDGSSSTTFNPLDPAIATGLKVQPFSTNKSNDTSYYVDRRLSLDPKFLTDHVLMLSKIPPRPFVHIKGHHRVHHKRTDNSRRENKEVIDFEIQIELTSLLYEDARTHKSWSTLKTAGNFEKVRRGTVFATRAAGFGGAGGIPEEGTPSAEDWCQRYCESPAGLKNFALERRITGWDFDLIKSKLENMIRATNYRGKLTIDFPVRNARVEMYNDCRTNRWRLTKWIEMIFVFTLMFIFTWPYLFFRTKKFETVYVEWPLSRDGRDRQQRDYISMSEERWYNMWARAVQKAVLDRRQGLLDQGDLARADGRDEQAQQWRGQVQGQVEAMGTVNRMFGWGADEN